MNSLAHSGIFRPKLPPIARTKAVRVGGMEPDAIARRIRTARTWAGLSQDDLADLLDVSGTTLGRWERGEKLPKMPTLFYLAEVCGIKRTWFTDPHAALEPMDDSGSLEAGVEAALQTDEQREAGGAPTESGSQRGHGHGGERERRVL